MPRIIKAGLIQAHNVAPADAPIDQTKKANLDNQMKFVENAAKQGVQMLCFQEIFTPPYSTRMESISANIERPISRMSHPASGKNFISAREISAIRVSIPRSGAS